MGNAGTAYGEFGTALRTGSYRLARNMAFGLPRIDLKDALRLTMLAAKKESDRHRYEAMARRWLERFIAETKPSLELIHFVAGDLENVGDPQCPAFVKQRSEHHLREVLGKL